jgi:uncharacterized protein (DUF2062 family)
MIRIMATITEKESYPTIVQRISGFFKQKLFKPLLNFLLQGISPEKLALAVVFGVLLGIFPMLGTTTLLCTLAALYLKLNMPAIQLINYFVYPLQLIFFIPFIRLGEFIFNEPPIPFSITQILEMLQNDMLGTIANFWYANLLGVAAWLIISLPLSFIIYHVTVRIFRKLAPKSHQSSDLMYKRSQRNIKTV